MTGEMKSIVLGGNALGSARTATEESATDSSENWS
jgi:hypothetical protein